VCSTHAVDKKCREQFGRESIMDDTIQTLRHSCEANMDITPKIKGLQGIGGSCGCVVVYYWVSQKAAHVISSYTLSTERSPQYCQPPHLKRTVTIPTSTSFPTIVQPFYLQSTASFFRSKQLPAFYGI